MEASMDKYKTDRNEDSSYDTARGEGSESASEFREHPDQPGYRS